MHVKERKQLSNNCTFSGTRADCILYICIPYTRTLSGLMQLSQHTLSLFIFTFSAARFYTTYVNTFLSFTMNHATSQMRPSRHKLDIKFSEAKMKNINFCAYHTCFVRRFHSSSSSSSASPFSLSSLVKMDISKTMQTS